MLNRRRFLTRTLQGSSLLGFGPAVPGFLARTARAAPPGKDTVLVVVELTGGNDGLNTVIPYADDLYHKNRPTLRYTKEQVIRVDDHVGLHPALKPLEGLLQKGQLAVVQGVGYPNPDRSHFESMDVWQSADPQRKAASGWLGRAVPELTGKADLPMIQVGAQKLPLALQGAAGSAISINDASPYRLELGGGEDQHARRRLLDEVARLPADDGNGLLDFVQRRQVRMLTTLDRLQEAVNPSVPPAPDPSGVEFGGRLADKLRLVARLIEKGFGTRIFYVALDGFDTHSEQMGVHAALLGDLAAGVTAFFDTLRKTGHAGRVRLLTFSEFGRRVKENGSKGTDHGAAACLFVAGPRLKGGAVGTHPSLADLDGGDLRFHTDFRRVYATLLDGWLGCDSKAVLGGAFEPVPALNG